MQFRCHRCGYVFHNGLPPIEALSVDQSVIVGVVFDGDPNDVLVGTVFEGMTVHNLCTFCLQAVVLHPEMFAKDGAPEEHNNFNWVSGPRQDLAPRRIATTTLECKDCGWKFTLSGFKVNNVSTHVLMNRLQVLHFLGMHHPLDVDPLEELLLWKDGDE